MPVNFKQIIRVVFLTFLLMMVGVSAVACSAYKVTADDKTMVGCNEDCWRVESKIWFKTVPEGGRYGACFTGSRKVRPHVYAPQSGMNEAGLVYSRLAAYYPTQSAEAGLKAVGDEVSFLEGVLHNCKTIAEVKAYFSPYDRSVFIQDVFFYVDASGDYLVVEPYGFYEGEEASYVLSNFCPTITEQPKARQLERYRNGQDFIAYHGLESTLGYCEAVSDTMHVCRSRNGDGTLLTSIWDSSKMVVNLYFYHEYGSSIQFDIRQELNEGDHMIDVPSLFAPNPEFERLASYITPFNTPGLRVFLLIAGAVLSMISLLFLMSYVSTRRKLKFNSVKLALLLVNAFSVVYLAVLATNKGIYYFDAPYTHYRYDLISMSSYIPVLLLVLIGPVLYYILQHVRANSVSAVVKGSFIVNALLYSLMLFGFVYWGLFNFWN